MEENKSLPPSNQVPDANPKPLTDPATKNPSIIAALATAGLIGKRAAPEEPVVAVASPLRRVKTKDLESGATDEEEKQIGVVGDIEELSTPSWQFEDEPADEPPHDAIYKRIEAKRLNLAQRFPRSLRGKGNSGYVIWISSCLKAHKGWMGLFRNTQGELVEDRLEPHLAEAVGWMQELFVQGITMRKYQPDPSEEEDIGDPGDGMGWLQEIVACAAATRRFPQSFLCRFRNETLETAVWLTRSDFGTNKSLLAEFRKRQMNRPEECMQVPYTRMILGASGPCSARKQQSLDLQNGSADYQNAESKTMPTGSPASLEAHKKRRSKRGRPRNIENQLDRNPARTAAINKKAYGYYELCVQKSINSVLLNGKLSVRDGKQLAVKSTNWIEFINELALILSRRAIGEVQVLAHSEAQDSSSIGKLKDFINPLLQEMQLGTWFLCFKAISEAVGHCAVISQGILCTDESYPVVCALGKEMQEIGVFTIKHARFGEKTQGKDLAKALSNLY